MKIRNHKKPMPPTEGGITEADPTSTNDVAVRYRHPTNVPEGSW